MPITPFIATGELLISGAAMLRRLPDMFRYEAQPLTYDMLFKDPRDGCALYDDVWGG
jgi:hypothetical protein